MAEKTMQVPPELAGARLDVALASMEPAWSRAFSHHLIQQGAVRSSSGGILQKPSYRVSDGETLCIDVPEPAPIETIAQDIPLDIVYEDHDMIIINKPKGLVVHPAAGNRDGTLVNALLHHCHDLSGIGGHARPGIVHRIDKDTTGLLAVAKHDAAHAALAAMIASRQMHRMYWCLVEGNVKEDEGTISAPIGRHPKDRKKMAVVANGRAAVTHYRVLERFGRFTLLEVRLDTGRTHQIRVHATHIGHPVVGDPVYGAKKQHPLASSQMLHAIRLELPHPTTGEPMCFFAPLPEAFDTLLNKLRKMQ